jgi:uncharacterized membrane protein (Fun14 family)
LHSFIRNLPQNPEARRKMSSEVLLSNIIPFAGSGLVGYAIGFALKKILKWILIIVGFLAGMFFVGVQLLQEYGYVVLLIGINYLKRCGFQNYKSE